MNTSRPLSRLLAAALTILLVMGFSLVRVVMDAAPAQAATTLVNETFAGSSVADPRFLPLGDACLTNAPRGGGTPPAAPAGASALKGCSLTNRTPGIANNGASGGWLQLTDSRTNRSGAAVYNQAIPASYGLQVEFEQAQYGGTMGADGIGFFLTDGAYTLNSTGAYGGSLGYASDETRPGVTGGFIGLGLDVWGNFNSTTEGRGAGCVAGGENPGSVRLPYSIGLRGPGGALLNSSTGDRNTDWTKGYCLLQSQAVAAAALRNTGTTPTATPSRYRLTVSPIAADRSVTVTVSVQINGTGSYQQVISRTVKDAPSTYKFGFSGSTGGETDVHLVRLRSVQTVQDITNLALTKTIDPESQLYQADGEYAVGETIPYSFTLTNGQTNPMTKREVPPGP